MFSNIDVKFAAAQELAKLIGPIASDFIFKSYKEYEWDALDTGKIFNHLEGSGSIANKAFLARIMSNVMPEQYRIKNQTFQFLFRYMLTNFIQWLGKSCKLSESIELDDDELDLPDEYYICLEVCEKILSNPQKDIFEDKFASKLTINEWKSLRICWMYLEPQFVSVQAQTIIKHLEVNFPFLFEENIWILKPTNASKGQGIKCTLELDEIIEHSESMEYALVAQKYLNSPLTVEMRKFDLRVWAMISCEENELHLYLFDCCYARFASKKFSLEDLTDKFAHLCNCAIQKHSEEDVNPMFPGNQWNSTQLANFLNRTHGDGTWTNIWKQIEEHTVDLFLATKEKLSTKHRGFEWLGLDFMVDEKMKVWLLEANVSPDNSYDTQVLAEMVPQATAGIFNLFLSKSENIDWQESAKNLNYDESKGKWIKLDSAPRKHLVSKPKPTCSAPPKMALRRILSN
eukprot:TRINITY_DN8874_c0_g1_i2.p1 TRINITY_DN8874_c0_g1~~TRINITY_DN8874_c0_g1_i2.p1  ORF type:complete len:458 (+),score=97.44 TRINITY_DN8874_c0_g1_i2:90-1463(+)